MPDPSKPKDLVVHQVQMSLGLEVATYQRIEDSTGSIEMGVFKDGVGFMSARALGRFCGVADSSIIRQSQKGTALESTKFGELLVRRGVEGAALFQKVQFEGHEINAYPEIVCMAFLEYYAFEADPRYRTEKALQMFRDLAATSLRQFIYQVTGYDPNRQAALSWQVFHDRLLLNKVPNGYFSIFSAMADFALDAIRHGLEFDDKTIPDISVGQMWSKFWVAEGLEPKYGVRVKYGHIYPDYFRQSKANDYIEAFIYPMAARGEFASWLQNVYIPRFLPKYLQNKEKAGAITAGRVQQLLKALEPTFLPSP